MPLAPFLPDNIAGVKESANPAEFPTLNVGGCVPIVEVKLVTFELRRVKIQNSQC